MKSFRYKTSLEYEEEDGINKLDYPTLTICSNSPVYHEHTFTDLPVHASVEEFKDFYLREISSVNYRYKNQPNLCFENEN